MNSDRPGDNPDGPAGPVGPKTEESYVSRNGLIAQSLTGEDRVHMTILDGPLTSVGLRGIPRTHGLSSVTSCSATRPLALRNLQPAPDRDVPEYVYDPQRQIAIDSTGAPWGPQLAKDWTSTEGTHTDGDGGDNESWGWEE